MAGLSSEQVSRVLGENPSPKDLELVVRALVISARRRGANEDEAYDLAMEAIHRGRKAAANREIPYPSSFIWRVLANGSIDATRKSSKLSPVPLLESHYAGGSIEDELLNKIFVSRVMDTLQQRLTTKEFDLIERYLEGIKPSELADQLGITESAVRRRIARLMHKLRHKIGDLLVTQDENPVVPDLSKSFSSKLLNRITAKLEADQ